MNRDRKVWIDVTDFLKWQGALTGFQHIQYNIAKQYVADGRNVAFFIYDQNTRAFRAIDFDPDTVSRNGINGADEFTKVQTHSLRRRVLVALKRRTPGPMKELGKKILGRVEGGPEPTGIRVTTNSPFTKEDEVIVLGGIWHGTFAEDMAQEKKKHGFTFIHIVHDMIPDRVPAFVVDGLPAVFRAYKRTIFRISDGLIINSESSKRDALAFMKANEITPPPIRVFRIADEAMSPKPTPRKGVTGEFMLSVGTIEVRKNHMLLYYAYKQGLREGKDLPPLVLVGRSGWLTDDLRYILEHDPEVKGRITLHYDVTNSELEWLYQNCLFTVWPSFYEGWGMPVAESLAHGKVTLSSDVSSMPEIAPRLLDLFSPYDSKECLDMMVKYLDKKVRVQKEREIRTRYKATTWHDMYKQISDFMDGL